jgi:hypothetical protein
MKLAILVLPARSGSGLTESEWFAVDAGSDSAGLKDHLSAYNGIDRPPYKFQASVWTPSCTAEYFLISDRMVPLHIDQGQISIKALTNTAFVWNAVYLGRSNTHPILHLL